MYNFGDKLVLKENKDIIEITGIFPAGQGIRIESAEKNYAMTLFGQKVYLPESLVSKMFNAWAVEEKKENKPVEQIIQEVVEETKPKTRKKKTIA